MSNLKEYKFLHPSVYCGNRYEKGSVHELDEETASALGDETVVEVPKSKQQKPVANKQQKPEDDK